MSESQHFTPETLDEAAALILAADTTGPALSEGARLVLQVTDGPRPSTLVVDLMRIPELNRLDYDERAGLRIGAAVSLSSLLEFPPVCRLYSILVDACGPNPPEGAENRASFGVILGNVRAAASIAPSLICLRASAAVYGPHGWSELGVEALLAGSRRTRIQPGEFLVDVRLPPPPPRSAGAYLRAAPQEAAGIGVFLVMEEDLLTCCGARLVFGEAGGPAWRALEAERFLAGKHLDTPAVQEAASRAMQEAQRQGEGPAATGEGLEATEGLACRAILAALARVR